MPPSKYPSWLQFWLSVFLFFFAYFLLLLFLSRGALSEFARFEFDCVNWLAPRIKWCSAFGRRATHQRISARMLHCKKMSVNWISQPCCTPASFSCPSAASLSKLESQTEPIPKANPFNYIYLIYIHTYIYVCICMVYRHLRGARMGRKIRWSPLLTWSSCFINILIEFSV